MHPIDTRRAGFTLIELIIVISIIAVLSAVVFVAVDPAKRLNASRNSSRWTDVAALLAAIKSYQGDNGGSFPATAVAIDSDANTVQIIGESVGACASLTCTGQTVAASSCGLNALDTDLRPYLKKIPKDPKSGTDNDARYYVNKDTYGMITVGACNAEAEGSGGSGTPPTIEKSG